MCDDHYVKKSSTPATCTQDEQIIYECSVCHRIKTEVGEKKTGHDYVVDSPKVDATCETAGKTEVKKCKNCGDTIGGDVIPALKHNYLLETENKKLPVQQTVKKLYINAQSAESIPAVK